MPLCRDRAITLQRHFYQTGRAKDAGSKNLGIVAGVKQTLTYLPIQYEEWLYGMGLSFGECDAIKKLPGYQNCLSGIKNVVDWQRYFAACKNRFGADYFDCSIAMLMKKSPYSRPVLKIFKDMQTYL